MPSNLEGTYAVLALILWWALVVVAFVGGFICGLLVWPFVVSIFNFLVGLFS